MKYRKLDDSVCRGLEYLAAHQRANGGFSSLRSTGMSNFDINSPRYQTVFAAALIGGALGNLKNEISLDVCKRIARYLHSQKDDNWSFNYWDKNDAMHKQAGLPNDLDDTFCALSVLYDVNPEIFNGDAMAHIVTLLCANEVQPGGPYNTWNSDISTWKDTDPVVNANISYFLQKHNVHLDGLTAYLHDAVTQGLTSSYYSSKIVVVYFIARAIPDIDMPIIKQFLLDELASGRNSLEVALAISTLLRLGAAEEQVSEYVGRLTELQAADGSWPACGLYVDARLKGGFEYAGSSELTTAFCIEAIDMYEHSLCRAEKTKQKSFKDNLIARVCREIAEVPSLEVQSKVRTTLTSVISGSKERNVIELPFFMASAIKGCEPSQKTLEDLSTMSMWGWIAYTMQDDYIDDRWGVDLVPIVSFCMKRLSQKIDMVTASNQEFKALTNQVLDIQDDANVWELQNCRMRVFGANKIDLVKLPNYDDGRQLANRALGHTISALGVMYAAGFTASSKEFIAIRKFFYHYLLARQLSDDAHDWEDDLVQGHINYVAAGILKYYILHNPPATSFIDINDHINELRKILWDYHIIEISELIIDHIAQARQAVGEFSVVFDIELLNGLLMPIELSAQKSLTERQKALDFIKHLEQ